MIKNRKIVLSIIVLFILALVFFVYKKNNKYNINAKIREYNLTKEKDQYLNYLKNFIKPVKLQNFINNGYINLSLYTNEASGNDVMAELYFEGYENLMTHLFDKKVEEFSDCPVTESFKSKFKTNLLSNFNIQESEDCEVNCMLNFEDNSVAVEVYGNFKNTEPTYWTTHHFKYTLDKDGNVDDVTFDYTE